jgi:flagellar motility protein MotE (MotC chaperone)
MSRGSAALTRFAGFLMFLSSAVTAAALSLLCYTFATGELPFGIQPILAPPAQLESALVEADTETEERVGESYAMGLYDELKAERDRLSRERGAIEEQKRLVEQLMEAERKLKSELIETEERVRELLVRTDATEVANVKRMAEMMEGADRRAAADMLLELDDALAARVLYSMKPRTSGEVIAELVRGGDKTRSDRATQVLEVFHRLSGEHEG